MLLKDLQGTEFGSSKEAFEELRLRAERAIIGGDALELDTRNWVVRLRDNAGTVLFEGTLVEATRAGLEDESVR